MKEFQSIVASYGAFCTIRRTMGADIASACGQLVVKKEKEETMATIDIEDGPFKDSNEVQEKAVSRGEENASSTSNNDDLSKWIKPLTIATSVAASCFVVSTIIFLSQKRKR